MNEHKKLAPMMEVAVEKSFDIIDKSWESKVFTKLYHSLRTSGLLAKLSDKNFRTLVCLSTFMNAQMGFEILLLFSAFYIRVN